MSRRTEHPQFGGTIDYDDRRARLFKDGVWFALVAASDGSWAVSLVEREPDTGHQPWRERLIPVARGVVNLDAKPPSHMPEWLHRPDFGQERRRWLAEEAACAHVHGHATNPDIQGITMKTYRIALLDVKTEAWGALIQALGLSEKMERTYFEHGEYASVEIEINENMVVVAGRVLPVR